eukprot:CAMPEP_0196598178 /NCGR_PEP_ID=MMETSP1081-20130531/94171_1 /TAXON_ID=36882 /ORGANISM="Pyramimonas amylifera, Strain CCMP720" /LENGTH=530 /DNA_ID=CAMNT_0041923837 /DNA_START=15 /DNA_END=1608 /DNA_ORIENTATION=+
MEVNADLSGTRSANVAVKIQNYSILEGDSLTVYLVTQALNLFLATTLLASSICIIRTTVTAYRRKSKLPSPLQMIELPLDFVIGVFVIVLVSVRIRARVNSATVIADLLGGLSSIPWADTNVSPNEKTALFFHGLDEIFSVINTEDGVGQMCHVLLILMLFRVILATNVHPRLALLTGTVGRSLDDMWHTVLLVITLNLMFAGIASWRFGSEYDNFATIFDAVQTQFQMLFGDCELEVWAEYDNFATIFDAVQTQFQMLFGEFPENWTNNNDIVFYTVLYLLVLYILVLNFVLAIIVEAYMTVRTHNEINEIELEFISDFVLCFVSRFKSWYHKWPPLLRVADHFACFPAKRTVAIDDLIDSELFPSQVSAVSFLNYYHVFDCLKRKPMIKITEHDRLVKDIETRVAWLLGKTPPSALDNIHCMSKEWKNRSTNVSETGSRVSKEKIDLHKLLRLLSLPDNMGASQSKGISRLSSLASENSSDNSPRAPLATVVEAATLPTREMESSSKPVEVKDSFNCDWSTVSPVYEN